MRWVLLLLLLVFSAIGSVVRADEHAKPDPKATAASLEGDWVLLPHKATLGAANNMVTWVDASGFTFFEPLGVKEFADLSYLRFEKGTLRLLTDLDKKWARAGVRVEPPDEGVREGGFCRIVFTKKCGQLVGICRVQGDKLEIRVPATCSCPKSGQIAVYQRVGK
jgi:hypothetical protein